MLLPNDVKEELSYVYAHAIATKVGYSTERRFKDRDSVDIMLCAKGKLDPSSTLIAPRLELQLKATSQELSGAEFPFSLSIKNYSDLRENTMVPKILVVYSLPQEENEWVQCTPELLALKGKAYWKNLRGADICENQTTKTIYISKSNIFNHDTLKKLMILASKSEELPNALV